MKPFLREFCEQLVEKHGVSGLKDLTIVIPSQRVAVYIRKHFSELIDEDFWLPEIMPINVFVERLSPEGTLDELELIFELYACYLKVFDQPEPFEDFLTWAPAIISDFNDIDKYLLNSEDVFRNLKSIKEIEAWSFNADELSDTQKTFMAFWEQLGELYQMLKRSLVEQGRTTASMIYRKLAEHPIEHLSSVKSGVYFIGFSALSKAEEAIFKYLVNSGVAEVIWDEDAYYVDDPVMEAGRFLRKQRTLGKPTLSITRENFKKPKSIKLYSANSNLAQTEVASSVLQQLDPSEASSTALVLADEKLLKPMLNVLPQDDTEVNVSMGYPITASDVFSLFEYAVLFQQNIERYRNDNQVYFKDLINLFQNEYIQMFSKDRQVDFDSFRKRIVAQNYTFVSHKMLREELGDKAEEMSFLWKRSVKTEAFLSDMIVFLNKLFDLLDDRQVIEKEALSALVDALQLVLTYQLKTGWINNVQVMNQLSRQLLRGLKMSFLGEPLSGIQLMGLLETRGLDFRNVILVSCNEEILPKASFGNSIIPFDLRNYLGLPTRDDREAIFAYYFYRLLQRAENIHLIYNGGVADQLSSNEVSRYVLQIAHELPALGSKIEEVQITVPREEAEKVNSQISQSVHFKGKLTEWLQNGISASAINSFLECPRNFFFTQILKLRQDEDVEENMEMSTYGTIVHEVLENLYRKAGEMIGKEQIEQMFSSYKQELNESMLKYFPGRNYLHGKNLLMYESALHTLKIFLGKEKEFIAKHGQIKVIGLEEKYEVTLDVKTDWGILPVKIKGLIDRVDLVGDTIRIIDYKTGKIDRLKGSLEDVQYNRYTLQLMLYLYLFPSKSSEKITSGIISFKQLNAGIQNLELDKQVCFQSDWLEQDFREMMDRYLKDIVNQMIASEYIHNPKNKYCILCA